MTQERVDTMLHNYREYVGRCKYLAAEIDEMTEDLKTLKASSYSDAVAPGAQNLNGMPHGTDVSSPTERIAVMFASGSKPTYIVELEKIIEELKCEYRRKWTTVVFVESWLQCLTDRERWIIVQQVIDGVTWRELTMQYEHCFGEARTRDGLKKLKQKALSKIYKTAA